MSWNGLSEDALPNWKSNKLLHAGYCPPPNVLADSMNGFKMSNSKEIDPLKLDKNMTIKPVEDQDLKWFDPTQPPFRLVGFPWFAKDKTYRRLPLKPSETLRDPVDRLANCTAGGQISFQSNSSRIVLRAQLAGPGTMYHMAVTGMCGFDLYIGSGKDQFFLSVSKFKFQDVKYESELFKATNAEWRTFTINFPLYQGVQEVLIGLEPQAQLKAPPEHALDGPIVIYGTSITQGGCASRPGMAYPNILSRALNLEVVNLGFSGNGRGEPEVAKLLTEIEKPALLVLDYHANCGGPEQLRETLPEFVRILRSTFQTVPILVVSVIDMPRNTIDPVAKQRTVECTEIQETFVNEARVAGDHHIHFLNGMTLLGADFDECTVDGVHPTDLGFLKMARSMEPVIRNILGLQES